MAPARAGKFPILLNRLSATARDSSAYPRLPSAGARSPSGPAPRTVALCWPSEWVAVAAPAAGRGLAVHGSTLPAGALLCAGNLRARAVSATRRSEI